MAGINQRVRYAQGDIQYPASDHGTYLTPVWATGASRPRDPDTSSLVAPPSEIFSSGYEDVSETSVPIKHTPASGQYLSLKAKSTDEHDYEKIPSVGRSRENRGRYQYRNVVIGAGAIIILMTAAACAVVYLYMNMRVEELQRVLEKKAGDTDQLTILNPTARTAGMVEDVSTQKQYELQDQNGVPEFYAWNPCPVEKRTFAFQNVTKSDTAHFDLANGNFTCTKDGPYLFQANLAAHPNSLANIGQHNFNCYFILYKDCFKIRMYVYSADRSSFRISFKNVVIHLRVGESVTLYCRLNGLYLTPMSYFYGILKTDAMSCKNFK